MFSEYIIRYHPSQIFRVLCIVFLLTAFFVSEKQPREEESLFPGIQNFFLQRIEAAVPYPESAFLEGLLLGYQENIPRSMKENFIEAGIIHILALSGWNITIIVLWLQRFFIFFMRRQYALVPTAFCIFFFVLLTGASPSLLRAAIMGILILIAQGLGRLVHVVNLLLASGVVLTFLNFALLRDIGFQLSYAATAGILFFAEPIKKWIRSEILASSLAAQCSTLPLIIFYFGRISLVAPVANLLVLPLVPWSMGLGFLAMIFRSHVLGWITWLPLAFIIKVAEFLSSFSYASVSLD